MKHTRTLRQQEAAAAKATTPRQPGPLTAEALAAKARLAEATARLRANGGMAVSVLERFNATGKE